MARYIESAGVQITEIDLTLNAQLPVGTNIFVNGFTDSGPTQELLNVTSLEEYKQVYGVPTNAAERYSYYTMTQLLNTNAKILFNRLPYGAEGGSGFNDMYTAMFYPVYSIIADASGNVVSGSNTALAYSAVAGVGQTVYHLIGKPTQVAINESTYNSWKAGEIVWDSNAMMLSGASPSGVSTGVSPSENAVGNSGIVIINKLKTSINQDFEGYYVAMSDNYQSSTTTNEADTTFDSVRSIYSSKNHVDGATSADKWSAMSSARLDFELTGNTTVGGSISESIEGVPSWDFGADSYSDAIILGVYKLRRSGFSVQENSLTFVPYESFIGSLGKDRKYTAPNAFQESTFFIENKVADDSVFLDVLVNPYLAKNVGIGDDSVPNKKVRVMSEMLRSSISGLSAEKYAALQADSAFSLGLYQTKADTKKLIGDVDGKIEIALALAEDYEKYPIDIVVDGGLSTIFTTSKLSNVSASEYEFSDVDAVSGIITDDKDGGKGLLDPSEGQSSLARTSWSTIFNRFDTFCRDTRKDCMFVADCLRQQLVLGKNQKILSDKTKNFSQHIYTPFKNLVSAANSNYSAIYAQWAQVYDTYSGEFVWIPFSGVQAAVMARMDANLFPWYAPAGLENGIVRNVTDIALTTTQKHRDLLYRNNINPVVFFPNDGIVTWGQKTLQKKPSALDRVNVRRLFLTLEKATRSIMKYFVFQPNTVFTRTRVKNVLTPIFDVAKNNEGVYDYKIVCDERNNSPAVIDNNELVTDIYLKPVRTGEFILVNFYSTRTDQNFDELI